MSLSDNYSLPDANISGKVQLAPINTNTNLECSTHNLSYNISLLSNKTDNNNHNHSDNHRFKSLSDKISMGRSKNGSKHTAVTIISNNNDNSYSSKVYDGIYSSSYEKVPSHVNGIYIDTMEYKVDNTTYNNYNIDHNYNTKRNHLQWIDDDANLYKECVEVSTVLLDNMIVDGLSRHDADETTTTTASMYNDRFIYDIEDNIHRIVNLDKNSTRCSSSVDNINIHDHDDIDIAATSDSNSMITTSNFMLDEKYHNNTSNVAKSSIVGAHIEVEENDNNYNHTKDRFVEEKHYDNKLPRINAQPLHHHHHLSNNSGNLSDNSHNDNDFKKENITNKSSKILSNTKFPPI